MTPPLSPSKSSIRRSSTSSSSRRQHQPRYQPQCDPFPQCHGPYSCVPGLALLSDSEESSYSSSCGTEEFFDFEELTSAFLMMDKWKKNRNKVHFGKASVQEYALTVGDHPVCKDGLAISLDWNHTAERVYHIDDYEIVRRRRKNKGFRGRRTSRLDYWQRREILQRVGSFTNHELSKIQRQRQEQSVKEFLASAGPDEPYLSDDEEEEKKEEEIQGVELLEMEYPEDDLITGLSYYDPRLEWHMKVQVLED